MMFASRASNHSNGGISTSISSSLTGMSSVDQVVRIISSIIQLDPTYASLNLKSRFESFIGIYLRTK